MIKFTRIINDWLTGISRSAFCLIVGHTIVYTILHYYLKKPYSKEYQALGMAIGLIFIFILWSWVNPTVERRKLLRYNFYKPYEDIFYHIQDKKENICYMGNRLEKDTERSIYLCTTELANADPKKTKNPVTVQVSLNFTKIP